MTWPISSIYSRLAAGAIRRRDLPKLQKMLSKGANPNAVAHRHLKGLYGKRSHLLHMAVDNNWEPGVRLLLQAGADTELRGTVFNQTALFQALDNYKPAVVGILLQYGARLDGRGWCLNHAKNQATLDLLGWDYPGQARLVEYHEIDVASYITRQTRDPELRRSVLSSVYERTSPAPPKSVHKPKM